METSDLDRSLGEEQELIAQTVAEFAADRVAPRHEALDHAAVHPEELWGEIAELGLFSTFVPEDRGGAGAGFVGHVVTIETLARAGGIAGVLPVAQGLVVDALLQAADGATVDAHLAALVTGEILGAAALVEDDAGHTATLAEGEGREVRLRGRKAMVPFPGRAGIYVVRARRGDGEVVVLVEASAAGLEHGAPEPTLGLLGFETAALTLEDTPGVVLGGEELIARLWSGARVAVSALLTGLARGAIGHAVRYAGERKQFGKELRRFTALQERLCRADARTESLRGLVFGAARLRDAGQPYAQGARRARLLAADVAVEACDHAVQVYGGYGYSREYPIERFYRDARFTGFGEHVPSRVVAESMDGLGE